MEKEERKGSLLTDHKIVYGGNPTESTVKPRELTVSSERTQNEDEHTRTDHIHIGGQQPFGSGNEK